MTEISNERASMPENFQTLTRFFGPMPPKEPVSLAPVHEGWRPEGRMQIWQVRIGQPAWLCWNLTLAWPPGECLGLLLSGDGCWPHVIDAPARAAVLGERRALAWFDRLQLSHDRSDAVRSGPVHEHWPDTPWGALAVWAWGLAHAARALRSLEPALPITVVGHSRGGKAALLAALGEPSIDAVVSHNSGCGGAASLQILGEGSESLAGMVQQFPHWFTPEAPKPEVQAALRACDAASVLRALAPRGLCLLQASDDLWANPLGTRATFEALQPAWATAPAALQWHERLGGHAMTALDWQRAARAAGPVAPDGD